MKSDLISDGYFKPSISKETKPELITQIKSGEQARRRSRSGLVTAVVTVPVLGECVPVAIALATRA